jgi:hypothetical protein
MSEAFEKNFLNYVAPNGPSFFPGKLGLDAGAGSAGTCSMPLATGPKWWDSTQARLSTWHGGTQQENGPTSFRATYSSAVQEGVFDFVYCIGVLSLARSEVGFQAYKSLATVARFGSGSIARGVVL